MALPRPQFGTNTWRRTPSRGPSYSESATTPMISMFELGVRAGAAADVLADGALAREEVLGEPAIDDRDRAVLVDVLSSAEVASFEKRHPHRLEVAGRQRVHERLHVFAVVGLMTLDAHGAVPLVAGQNRHGGIAADLTPGADAQIARAAGRRKPRLADSS